jgi:hypothetical protein
MMKATTMYRGSIRRHSLRKIISGTVVAGGGGGSGGGGPTTTAPGTGGTSF